MKTHLIAPLAALLLGGCVAVHSGTMTGNAALSEANFAVVGYAYGTAEATYIFGIGGWGKEALVLDAKRNLYENYPLQPGQALANVTVDFRTHAIPIVPVTRRRVTISADIVDFNPGAQPAPVADIIGPDPVPMAIAQLGDTVIAYEDAFVNIERDAVVIDRRGSVSKVRYFDGQGDFRITTVNTGKYSPSSPEEGLKGGKSRLRYKVGDQIRFIYRDEVFEGVIQKVFENSVLVDFKSPQGEETTIRLPMWKVIPPARESTE